MLSSTCIKEGWGNDRDVGEQTWKNPHGYSGKKWSSEKRAKFMKPGPFLALGACFSLSGAVT